jgi:hypothetical protein
VQRAWEPEDLISAWTLLDRDWQLIGNKTGPTRRSACSLPCSFGPAHPAIPLHLLPSDGILTTLYKATSVASLDSGH